MAACRIITSPKTKERVESKLWNQLYNITGSEYEADMFYDLTLTPEFTKEFGDWINDPESVKGKTDFNGEPLFDEVKSFFFDEEFDSEAVSISRYKGDYAEIEPGSEKEYQLVTPSTPWRGRSEMLNSHGIKKYAGVYYYVLNKDQQQRIDKYNSLVGKFGKQAGDTKKGFELETSQSTGDIVYRRENDVEYLYITEYEWVTDSDGIKVPQVSKRYKVKAQIVQHHGEKDFRRILASGSIYQYTLAKKMAKYLFKIDNISDKKSASYMMYRMKANIINMMATFSKDKYQLDFDTLIDMTYEELVDYFDQLDIPETIKTAIADYEKHKSRRTPQEIKDDILSQLDGLNWFETENKRTDFKALLNALPENFLQLISFYATDEAFFAEHEITDPKHFPLDSFFKTRNKIDDLLSKRKAMAINVALRRMVDEGIITRKTIDLMNKDILPGVELFVRMRERSINPILLDRTRSMFFKKIHTIEKHLGSPENVETFNKYWKEAEESTAEVIKSKNEMLYTMATLIVEDIPPGFNPFTEIQLGIPRDDIESKTGTPFDPVIIAAHEIGHALDYYSFLTKGWFSIKVKNFLEDLRGIPEFRIYIADGLMTRGYMPYNMPEIMADFYAYLIARAANIDVSNSHLQTLHEFFTRPREGDVASERFGAELYHAMTKHFPEFKVFWLRRRSEVTSEARVMNAIIEFFRSLINSVISKINKTLKFEAITQITPNGKYTITNDKVEAFLDHVTDFLLKDLHFDVDFLIRNSYRLKKKSIQFKDVEDTHNIKRESITERLKALGINKRTNLSDQQRINALKKVKEYNRKNNTQYYLEFKRIGQSYSYEIVNVLNRKTDIPGQGRLFALGRKFSSDFDIMNEEFESMMKRVIENAGMSIEHVKDLKDKYGIDAFAVTDFVNRVVRFSDKATPQDRLEEYAHIISALYGHNNPLMERARELISKTEFYKQVQEQYKDAGYTEQEMQQEAVDQAMAQVMSENEEFVDKSIIQRIKNILNKIIDWVFNRTRTIDMEQYDNEMREIFAEVLEPIKTGEAIRQKIDFSKVKARVLYALEPGLFKKSNLLDGYEKELKRGMKILFDKMVIANYHSKGSRKGEITKADEKTMLDLQKASNEMRTTYGMVKWLNLIEKEVIDTLTNLKLIIEDLNKVPLEETAKLMNKSHNFTGLYQPLLESLLSSDELEKYAEGAFSAEAKKAGVEVDPETANKEDLAKKLLFQISEILRKIVKIENIYGEISSKLVAESFWEFAKNNPKYENDKDKFAKDLLVMDQDIGLFRYLLDSMAESGDDVLAVIDRYVKDYKIEAYRDTELMVKDLLLTYQKLEDLGVKGTEWGYERNENGELTGNLLSEYNWDAYEKEMQDEIDKLDKETFPEEIKTWDDKYSYLSIRGGKRGRYWRKRREIEVKYTKPNPELEKIKEEKKNDFYNYYVTASDKEVKARQEQQAEDAYLKWLSSNESPVRRGSKEYHYRNDLALPHDRYKNKEWERMSKSNDPVDKAKIEFMTKLYELKGKVMKYLPPVYREMYRAPMLRKDWLERLKSVDSFEAFKDNAYQELRDAYMLREDDEEWGYLATDPAGQRVDFIPVFYVSPLTKRTGEVDEAGNPIIKKDMSDLSTDLLSGMALYIDMANNFRQMTKIIGLLSLTDDVLRQRKISTGKQSLGKNLKDSLTSLEGFKNASSTELKNQAIAEIYSFWKGSDSAYKRETGGWAYKRFKDYMEMVVYGRMKAEESWGDKLGVNGPKLLDTFNKYVAIQNLALNIYAGLANPILGELLLRTEAFAKSFVDHEDMWEADKIYFQNIHDVLRDLGKLNSTSKLRLWGERFDIMEDYKTEFRELDSNRGRAARMANVSTLFFVNTIGEHQMRFRLALAIANRIKVKDKQGNIMNFFEAYEVVGNRVELRPDITLEDGTKVDRQFEKRFELKVKKLNRRLHGIYNDTDRNVLQRWALGRMVMMFRKWLKPGINRRFDNRRYDYELETEFEGYYTTALSFIKSWLTDVIMAEKTFKTLYEEKIQNDPIAQENWRRFWAEVSFLTGAFVLSSATIVASSSYDDDDTWESWALHMAAYQSRRAITEALFFLPSEALRLMKSPAAGINQAEQILSIFRTIDFTGALQGDPFFRRYKSGKNKDQLYLAVWLERMMPMYSTVEDWFHPSERLQFFTN